jgi:glycolate oxidase subunit GlcD
MKQRAHQPALPRTETGLSRSGPPGEGPALLADLRRLLPPERLVVAAADLYSYECDGQTLDRALPLAVAFPETTAEVAAIVGACAARAMPFLARGAGTGLSGGAVAMGSVVICTARMNQIHDIDLANRQAWVGPGVVNAHLSRAVAAHGLHYAPDPSSQNACTIGGNVAENSGGPHTLKYGVTTNHILALEVVLPDGSVTQLGGCALDAPGPDLVSAFVGSEGTFGIATRILVRLTPVPEGVRTALAIFDRVADACRAVTEILARGITPAALELIDQITLRAVEAHIHAGFPLDAAAVLLVEVDGLADELDEQAAAVLEGCRAAGVREVRLARDEAERSKLWKGRKQAFGALGRLAPNYYTHDGVIPRTRLPEVLEEIALIAERHALTIGNVFHAGDGNLHPVVLYDERDPGVIERVRAAGDAILRLVIGVGGALSGEHGIGLEKIAYMAALYDENDLDQMRRLRQVFDPRGLSNPGKVIPAPGRCVEPGADGGRRLPLGH